MKVKNFNDYLSTRLNDSEIETQAEREFQALKNGVDQVVNEKDNDF